MSDFLTRLAERALGAPGAVRPKLPRRFAPLPPPPDADLAWWSAELRAAQGAASGDGAPPPHLRAVAAPPSRPAPARGPLPPRRPR